MYIDFNELSLFSQYIKNLNTRVLPKLSLQTGFMFEENKGNPLKIRTSDYMNCQKA